MAEMAESEPIPSSSEDPSPLVDVKGDDGPPEKRRKLEKDDSSDKLEHRLGGILCCAVCLDLPQAAVYQCSNGHLMCAPCFSHLLADARLRDESATCPNCRVEISKTSASRNLAVEKTVSELPSECKSCGCVFPRHSLQNHEEKTCEERLMGCQYSCIGCPWLGPAHEVGAHEAACAHPAKSASEVVAVLGERERRAAEARALHRQLLELLSSEKMTFNDLQLKPYRTEEFLHKLYYETSRFPAFGHQWVVKAFVNKNQRDPTQSTTRELTYQLVLKSRSASALGVQWVCLRGPFGEAELCARAELCVFGDDCAEAPARPLPLAHSADANRLLANKAIHFRLIMFQTSN